MQYVIINYFGQIQGIVEGYSSKDDVISELTTLALPYKEAKDNYKYYPINDLRNYKNDEKWILSEKNRAILMEISEKRIKYKNKLYRIDQIFELSKCNVLTMNEFIDKYTLNDNSDTNI